MINDEEKRWRGCVVEDFKMVQRKLHGHDSFLISLAMMSIVALILAVMAVVK